jgi:hypothetical protein
VRYWAVLGLWFRGESAMKPALTELTPVLNDASASCRVAAAEAIATYGDGAQRRQALATLMDVASKNRDDYFAAAAAWYALDRLDGLAAPVRDELAKLNTANPKKQNLPRYGRVANHLKQLAKRTLQDIDAAASAEPL